MNVFTQKVEKFLMPTSKIENALFDRRKNDAFYDNSLVIVKTGGSKTTPVEVLVSVDYHGLREQGKDITESQRLTAYDKEIHNAVISLYNAGNQYLSPNIIHNVLSGNKEYEGGSRKSLTVNGRQEVLTSLSKMMETSIEIDARKEGRAFTGEEYQYSGKLLPSCFVNGVSLNNNPVKHCLHLLSSPPLLEYSKVRRQLTSVDVYLLGVLTTRVIHVVVKNYLLRELLWMKHSKERKRVIRYDTLQEYIGSVSSGSKDDITHRRQRLRANVIRCLNYWVSQDFIKGYREEKERNIFSKVVLII
jgi:hypothetical protein